MYIVLLCFLVVIILALLAYYKPDWFKKTDV